MLREICHTHVHTHTGTYMPTDNIAISCLSYFHTKEWIKVNERSEKKGRKSIINGKTAQGKWC